MAVNQLNCIATTSILRLKLVMKTVIAPHMIKQSISHPKLDCVFMGQQSNKGYGIPLSFQ